MTSVLNVHEVAIVVAVGRTAADSPFEVTPHNHWKLSDDGI